MQDFMLAAEGAAAARSSNGLSLHMNSFQCCSGGGGSCHHSSSSSSSSRGKISCISSHGDSSETSNGRCVGGS